MRKSFIVCAVALIGIISFCLLGCAKKKSELPPAEMQTQTAAPQAQLSSEALTTQAVSKIETPSLSQETMAKHAASIAADKSTHASISSGKPSAEEIQTALKNAGYYSGAIDAKIGPKSKKAIENFQKDNGLVIDGKVGPKTWSKLQPHLSAAAAEKTGD